MLIEHGAATIALQIENGRFLSAFPSTIFRHYHDFERDNPLDLLTAENELKDQNLLDSGGPLPLRPDKNGEFIANIEYHAQIITEKQSSEI